MDFLAKTTVVRRQTPTSICPGKRYKQILIGHLDSPSLVVIVLGYCQCEFKAFGVTREILASIPKTVSSGLELAQKLILNNSCGSCHQEKINSRTQHVFSIKMDIWMWIQVEE